MPAAASWPGVIMGTAGCLDLFFGQVFMRSEWGSVRRNENNNRELVKVIKE